RLPAVPRRGPERLAEPDVQRLRRGVGDSRPRRRDLRPEHVLQLAGVRVVPLRELELSVRGQPLPARRGILTRQRATRESSSESTRLATPEAARSPFRTVIG